ncbi:MAG TPA: hypothetical protein VEL47_02320, partial [Myxococcota bacterium]|nr:hypothetical protein [Myxococcota bacterium]
MAKLWCSFLIIFLVACNDHKPADQKTQRTGNDGQSGQTTQRTSNDNQSGPTWTENGFLADFQSKARKFSTKGNSVAHGESVTAFEKLCDLRYDAIKSDMIYLEFSQAQNTGKLYCGKSPVKVTFKYDVVNDSLLKFKDLQFD